MMLARALMRRTEKGKHYGIVTAKFVDVLRGVLWGVHNAASGRCFPSYEAIAEAAACSRTTAAPSGCSSSFLTWVNRIKRVREWVPGLFGKVSAWRWRVIRTSNAYAFTDPQTSKFNFQTGTTAQADFDARSARIERGHRTCIGLCCLSGPWRRSWRRRSWRRRSWRRSFAHMGGHMGHFAHIGGHVGHFALWVISATLVVSLTWAVSVTFALPVIGRIAIGPGAIPGTVTFGPLAVGITERAHDGSSPSIQL